MLYSNFDGRIAPPCPENYAYASTTCSALSLALSLRSSGLFKLPYYLRRLTRVVAGRIIAPVFLALESKKSAKVSTQ